MSKSIRLRASEGKRRINFTSGLIKTATKHVESLQRQLFRAISECKLRKIIRFQLLLKNSYYNKLLALYKVAHLNKGKKTAGVDGIKIKLADNKQITKVMNDLTRDLNRNKWTPKPVRRVYIPKPDGTKRPLGIPTQYDRVVQFILNTILEVSVENLIHSQGIRSYGFRRHNSTADAIANLTSFAWKGKNVRIIEADISKCFDKISHSYTLSLLNGNVIQPFIQKLLEAGHVDDDNARIMSTEGTPQGDVISPTLSNLVLRNVLDAPMTRMKAGHFGKNINGITLTTYADDLVLSIAPRDNIKWDEVTTNILKWVKEQLSSADLEL